MILVRDNVERIAMEPHRIAKLKQAGYAVVDGELEEEQKNEPIPENIDEMNVSELRSLAKTRGIKAAGSLSKSDLLRTLKEK